MARRLSSLTKGREVKPPIVIVYGLHGVGKTKFCSDAPSPIFQFCEDGRGLLDLVSFSGIAKSTKEVFEGIEELTREDHSFKTYVLDSLDWFESIVHREIIETHGKDIFVTYGKGFVFAIPYFQQLFARLTELRNAKQMMILCTAHSAIKRFDSPESDPYDRYGLDLHDKVSSTCEEWADAVLFCNYKTNVIKTDAGFNKKVSRGVGSGNRVLYTEERPAYRAKNRFNLPLELPLSFDAFLSALNEGMSRTEAPPPEEVPEGDQKQAAATA